MNPVAACYLDRGIEYFRRNEFARAIAHFDVALKIDPNEPYARYNRATALLSSGDYERGFVEHEVAWRLFHWRGFGPVGDDIDRLQELPLWRGESACRLLVYHELGYGDAIMAMRYLPELKRRAAVTLVIDSCLARLTTEHFDVEVTDKVPDDLRGYDFRLPLFGVMAALGETGATIARAPYIGACKFASGGNRVGIAWSGRTQTAFSAEYFCSMLPYHSAKFYALQPGAAPDGVEPLRPGSDFADLADRMAAMDHIVTVDTAAIHLAGAMGHPSAHLLLPFLSDWRWHRSELWYPNLKTYRQDNALEWAAPFSRLNAHLPLPRILERGKTPSSAANGLEGFP